MTGVVRYAGRTDGPGVDDAPSGPEIVEAVFAGAQAVAIDDPLSFPWHLVDDEHWRVPVTVDLRGCDDDDLTALLEVLPVLTPDDRLVVDPGTRSILAGRLALPDTCYLDETGDSDAAAEARRPAKLRRALLREVLQPIVDRELDVAGGGEHSRPLLVVEFGAESGWHSSLVPSPHRYEARSDGEPGVARSAAVAMVASAALDSETIAAALEALQPGGLLILVLDERVVASADSPWTSEVFSLIDAATSRRRVVEHVWGLHPRPGARTLGGVIAVRPLGAGT